MSVRSYSLLAPADVGLVEDLIHDRINAVCADVIDALDDADMDADTLADVVLGTVGTFPDDPEAVALIRQLAPVDRLAIVRRIAAEYVSVPAVEGGVA